MANGNAQQAQLQAYISGQPTLKQGGASPTAPTAPPTPAGGKKPAQSPKGQSQDFFANLNATIDQQNAASAQQTIKQGAASSGAQLGTAAAGSAQNLGDTIAASDLEGAVEEEGKTSTPSVLGTVAANLAEGAQNTTEKVTGFAEKLPTPGGIALLIAILIAFLWAVVPVNAGMTRAQLLWYVLAQKAALIPPGGLSDWEKQFAQAQGIQGAGVYNSSPVPGSGPGTGTPIVQLSSSTPTPTVTTPSITPGLSLSPNVGFIPDFSNL